MKICILEACYTDIKQNINKSQSNDYSNYRDGDRADAKELARLTGTRDKNPQFVVSTGNKLYLYTKTDQADSRRGYRIRYYEGNFNIVP